MTANPKWSFEAHDLNSVVLARNNLAEVTLAKLDESPDMRDPANMTHLIGNLTIVACAATEEYRRPSENVMAALADVAEEGQRTAYAFDRLLTRDVVRYIFALQHIPHGAPEVRETKRSRELKVDEFIHQAHLLAPDAVEPTGYEGTGRHLFMGWYLRKLH